MGVFSRGGGAWSEVVLRNVTSEGVGERGKRPAHQRGACGDCVGEEVRTGPSSGNGKREHFCDGSDKTGEQQDVVDKGEKRRESPSFKEYLKIQEG